MADLSSKAAGRAMLLIPIRPSSCLPSGTTAYVLPKQVWGSVLELMLLGNSFFKSTLSNAQILVKYGGLWFRYMVRSKSFVTYNTWRSFKATTPSTGSRVIFIRMKSLTGMNHYIRLPLLLLLILFPMHSLTSLTFWINLIVELSKDILGNIQSSDRKRICFQILRQLSPRILPMAGLASMEAAVILFYDQKMSKKWRNWCQKCTLKYQRATELIVSF